MTSLDPRKSFFNYIKDKEGSIDYLDMVIFIGSIDEIRLKDKYTFHRIFILKENNKLIYCNDNCYFQHLINLIPDLEKNLIKNVSLETMEMYCELVNTFNKNKHLFLKNIKELSKNLNQNPYEVFQIMKLNSMVGSNFDNPEIKK